MGRYEDLILAEREIFDSIIAYTSSTDQQNAFLGYLPDITNAWCLKFEGSDFEGDFCSRFPPLKYAIEGRFAEQEDAYNFIYLIKKWWTAQQSEESWFLTNSKNVIFNEFNAPEQDWVRLYKQKRNTSHWHVNISFAVEFLQSDFAFEYSSSSSSSSEGFSSSSSSSEEYSSSSSSSSISSESSSSSVGFSSSSSSEPDGNNWLVDAHTWLAQDATPMLNNTDPSWTFNGTFYWGTFGSIDTSWISYKRRWLSLQDENRVYGSTWAINMRIKSTTLQDTYNSNGRPSMHRANPASVEGGFFISHQAEFSAGSATQTEIRVREGGVTNSFFLPWGYAGSEGIWHNITITSGDGDTRLYVDGAHRYTRSGNTNIPTSANPTYLGINSGVLGSSFTVEGMRHFSWLDYKPSDDEVTNVIHTAMNGFNP